MKPIWIVAAAREGINYNDVDPIAEGCDYFVCEVLYCLSSVAIGGRDDLNEGNDAVAGCMPDRDGSLAF